MGVWERIALGSVVDWPGTHSFGLEPPVHPVVVSLVRPSALSIDGTTLLLFPAEAGMQWITLIACDMGPGVQLGHRSRGVGRHANAFDYRRAHRGRHGVSRLARSAHAASHTHRARPRLTGSARTAVKQGLPLQPPGPRLLTAECGGRVSRPAAPKPKDRPLLPPQTISLGRARSPSDRSTRMV